MGDQRDASALRTSTASVRRSARRGTCDARGQRETGAARLTGRVFIEAAGSVQPASRTERPGLRPGPLVPVQYPLARDRQ